MTNRVIDTNGWIEIKNNPITRVGVFDYLGSSLGRGFIPDKVYKVYRPAEELSKSETINSFKLLPWTNDHPAKLLGNKPELLPAEYKGVDGVTGEEIIFDGDFLRSNIKVFSKELADDIQSGKIGLSIGYRFRCDIQSGTYNGEPYEIIQRDLFGNHLSSVDEGRSGQEVSVLDKAEEKLMEPNDTKTEGESSLGLGSLKTLLDGLVSKVEALASKVEAMTSVGVEDKKGMDEGDKDKKEDDKKTMDEEDKEKKKDGYAMDAAFIRKSLIKELAEKEAIIKEASREIGIFDAADKTLIETTEYIARQLGIQCKKEESHRMVTAYLAGIRASKKGISANAMDKKSDVPNQVHAYLGRK